MTPADRLHATLDLLAELETSSRPADAVTSAFFRAAELGGEDRGAVLELAYALMRHRARLGWWLARAGQKDSGRNRLSAWLVLSGAATPAEARRMLGGATPEALTGPVDHPEMPEAVRLEIPAWAEAPLRRRFGAALAEEMAASLRVPPLDLRINPVKTTREAALRDLASLGAKATALSPLGLRLPGRVALERLKGLKTGEIEIQDEGSQLVALALGARPGERVVDFCAGAGGKTLAISAQMENRGHVVACDTSEARLKRAAERLRKAGLHNVETRVLSSETDKWIKRHKLSYDRVLVDAPCTGTGTWRRNPDARWRAPDLGLEGLVALQGRILSSAARLVKPGGRLVYATCSLLVEENEDQVAGFLAATPGFRVAEPALSLTPLQHGTDGFFAAVLERQA